MTFNEWVSFIFDHPVTDPAWYWDTSGEYDGPDLSDPQVVTYLTRLFTEADVVLLPYTDAQANQGLWMLASNSCSDYMFSLREADVPLEDRLVCIRGMAALFERCFARRCSPHLSHLDEPGSSPLNGICYMWWDVLPITGLIYHAPERSDSAEIDRACLDVMQQTLEIDSVACRESALHGLGHWSHYYPSVKGVIDAFLRRNPRLRPELRSYAKAARQGCVQ